MSNRTYKLWAYSPSHSRLVIRSLSSDADPANEDHVFTGVTHLDVPQSITGLSVQEPDGADHTTRVFELTGIVGGERRPVGSIHARDHRTSQNELAQFQTELDDVLPDVASGVELERRVLVGLAASALRISAPPAGVPVDLFVSASDGQRIAVEVKWFAGRPTARALRSLVRAIAQSLPDDVAGLVFIVGGVLDRGGRAGFTEDLSRELVSALPVRVRSAVFAIEDVPMTAMALRLDNMLKAS